MVVDVVIRWTIYNEVTVLRDSLCFCLTRNWQLECDWSGVLGYIIYGFGHGKTAILRPEPFCQVCHSWVSHGRYTAILISTVMILSVCMPHGRYDEENYIAELEIVKIIMEEGQKMGAKDFFIGGDLNIELELEGGNMECHGFDSLDWNGVHGLECRGGGPRRRR